MVFIMANGPSNQPNIKSYEVEDYDHYIGELQRIIDESPPGMQARFARLINYLSQKRSDLKRITEDDGSVDKKEIYQMILGRVEKELEQSDNSGQKFQDLLELARLREFISQQKQRHGF